MYSPTWPAKKSLLMSSIRESLKKKAEPGQPTPTRWEANRTWREDILGIVKKTGKPQTEKFDKSDEEDAPKSSKSSKPSKSNRR